MTTTIRLSAPVALISGSLALPLLFIAMWSSGYVVGKLAVPYAAPFTLLTLRFGLGAALLLLIALASRAPWQGSWKALGHLVVVGLLIQALQFSGLYSPSNWASRPANRPSSSAPCPCSRRWARR